jgi:hypothetical protein
MLAALVNRPLTRPPRLVKAPAAGHPLPKGEGLDSLGFSLVPSP